MFCSSCGIDRSENARRINPGYCAMGARHQHSWVADPGRVLTDAEMRALADTGRAPDMPTSSEMAREIAAALHDEPAPVVGKSASIEPAPVVIEPKRDTNFETAAQAWLFLSTLNLQDQPTEVQRKQVEITARLGHTLRKSPLWKAWAAQHDKRPKVEERPMLDEEDLL